MCVLPGWPLTFHLTCIYSTSLCEGDNVRPPPHWPEWTDANVNSWRVLHILQSPCPLRRETPSGVLITLSRPGLFWWWGTNIYFKLTTLKESKRICGAGFNFFFNASLLLHSSKCHYRSVNILWFSLKSHELDSWKFHFNHLNSVDLY